MGGGEKLAAGTRRTSRISYLAAQRAVSLSRGSGFASHFAAPHSRISSAPLSWMLRSPRSRLQSNVVRANGGLATTRNGRLRQRHPAQVVLDDSDLRFAVEPSPEPLGQLGIELDRDHPGAGTGQRRRECAIPRAHVENQVTGTGTAGFDKLVDQSAVSQEVRTSGILRRPRQPAWPPWHGRP